MHQRTVHISVSLFIVPDNFTDFTQTSDLKRKQCSDLYTMVEMKLRRN